MTSPQVPRSNAPNGIASDYSEQPVKNDVTPACATESVLEGFEIIGVGDKAGVSFDSIAAFQPSVPKSKKEAIKAFRFEKLPTDERVIAFLEIMTHHNKKFIKWIGKDDLKYVATAEEISCEYKDTTLSIKKLQLDLPQVQARLEQESMRQEPEALACFVADFERGKDRSTFHYANEQLILEFEQIKAFFGDQMTSVSPLINQGLFAVLSDVATEIKPEVVFNCPATPMTVYYHQRTSADKLHIKVKLIQDIYRGKKIDSDELLSTDENILLYLCYEAEIIFTKDSFQVVSAQVSYRSKEK